MHTHPEQQPLEHGLAYPPGFLDALPILQDRPPPHQPLRTLDAAQFAQVHLAYTTAHAPDAVLFPFLHGIEGQNHAQNAFFAHGRAHPAALPPVPRFRGLVWVTADDLDMDEGDMEGDADELDDDDDDFSSSESLESFGPMDIDVDVGVDGDPSMAVDHDGMEPDARASSSGDKAQRGNGVASAEQHHQAARHTPPPPKPIFLTSSFRARELLQTRAVPGVGLKHTFLEPNVPDGISLRNFGIQVPIYATLSDIVVYSPRGDMRAAHGLAAAFKDAIEAKYATRAARMHAVAAANTSPSSSASSSPSPPCSPPPRPTPNGRLAQGSAAPDSQVDMDVTEALLPYNVFVLDASPADIAAKLPHLVARPEPPMRSAAHTDGTDAHTQGEGAEEAWRRRAARPNIVDFAVREREEMRDLTRASELITVLPPRPSNKDADDADERVKSYAGTTPASRFEPQAGQVFLGNAHDAPPTHPAAVTPFSPGANAPKCGRGFDLCIECYDFAPLPTMAQLRAAEGQIAALDRAWAEQCLADDEDGTGEARDAEELPTRPPPHHSVVVHLTFPSSPVATATSVNALLPILAFLERLIAPPAHLPTRGSARALLFPAPPQTHPPSHGSRRASEAGTFGPRSLPPPSAFPTSFFPAAHAQGPQAAYTRVRSTSATCPPGSSSPAPPSSPSPSSSTSAGSSPASPDAAGALRTRPAKVLVHSADGYTESSVLGLALLMAHRALPLPAAYLALQLEKRRSFFVYQADIPLLRRIEARLLRERAAREEDAREARGAGPASARERAPWGSWSRLSEKSVSFATGGGGVNMDGAAMQGDARPVAMHVCRTVSDSRPPGTFGAAQGRPRAHTLPLALPEGGGDELWFNDPKFDGSFPSRVLPFLYLGNLNHAANAFMLHALGITHVVSVGECALVPPPEAEAPAGGRGAQGSLWHEEREGRIKVLDIKGVCDDGIDTLAPQLEPICEWIERARAEGGTVLVHCRVGVSRSATVTIAYVMKHLQLPLVDAYLIVRSRRLSVLIQPNMRLLYNLLGWELHLARERAAGDEERLRYELARSLNWPYLAKEVHALNEKYLH